MLPVLIYEPDDAIRSALLEGLDALKGQGLPDTRVEVSTGAADTVERAINAQNGICLAIFGIPEGRARDCSDMGNLVMRHNRYSYTLFCLHDPRDLGELLENCMRPAGILTAPLSDRSLKSNLTRILEDYRGLTGDAPADDCMIVETGGAAYRIAYDQILYLEAVDKLLTIHTRQQSISVRRSLSAIEKTLPEGFVRCHRAFVVNSQYIDQVNYSAMTLSLQTGDTLPLSRSQRTELKGLMDRQKGGIA